MLIHRRGPWRSFEAVEFATLEFGFGAARELFRAWVLVLNIYQIRGFEVRGFTEVEAIAALELVDRLRGGPPGRPGNLCN